jgi:hypothetical protein
MKCMNIPAVFPRDSVESNEDTHRHFQARAPAKLQVIVPPGIFHIIPMVQKKRNHFPEKFTHDSGFFRFNLQSDTIRTALRDSGATFLDDGQMGLDVDPAEDGKEVKQPVLINRLEVEFVLNNRRDADATSVDRRDADATSVDRRDADATFDRSARRRCHDQLLAAC